MSDRFGGGLQEGVFDWQLTADLRNQADTGYDASRWWGGFPMDVDPHAPLPDWAIGPFTKSPCNPILGPSEGAWDCGRYGGGVHNGSVVMHEGQFHYVYRGERPLHPPINSCDYVCDIGLATSDDGMRFTKDTTHSPFFRRGGDAHCSFEDVSLVRYGELYYLFCNRWDWARHSDPAASGVFLATSPDLRHWTSRGLVFPDAQIIHRNPVILQDPDNNAVRVNGQFVMYLNFGLIAYSDDLVNWRSRPIADPWPGGENCFALADWSPRHPDRILVFTGGPHSGHFYAVGEVLLDRNQPERALEWLPRPVLTADPALPWEHGQSAQPPHQRVSQFRDCIFFNGLTRWQNQWMLYYGGSEFYTCLATAPAL